jgi:hypothetical protein
MTLLLLAAALVAHSDRAPSSSIDSVFTPNAAVCVKIDARGHVLDAAVDGRTDRPELNKQMVAFLRTRSWPAPARHAAGKWFALSLAPDGSPVPELLPDCSNLPQGK